VCPSRLDELEGHLPADRAELFSEIDDAEAPFAEDFEELVGTDG
jgi:hypothetical protein